MSEAMLLISSWALGFGSACAFVMLLDWLKERREDREAAR